MTVANKNYTIHDPINFDEQLLKDFSIESSIPLVPPLGAFHLAIRLKDGQFPCVDGIGYPGLICRYILKDYMKEDYEIYIQDVFKKLNYYGNFVNIYFNDARKSSIGITLSDNYTSIKEIASIHFDYEINFRDKKYYYTKTSEIYIIFKGESCYDVITDSNNQTKLKLVINYNDLDGFFIKFIECYKNKFTKKVGVQRNTDTTKLKYLVDMILF